VDTARAPSPLLLCHGFAGSGKSFASERLAPLIGAVRIVNGIERKRTRPLSSPDAGRLSEESYSADAIDEQYDRLLALTRHVLDAGPTALVDATFIRRTNSPCRC